MLELRGHGTLKATGKTLHGIAAVFNSEANLGTFSEVIRPGAFAKSLATGSNIRALYHHDGSALLGTTRGGTLQLRETPQGLAFELALPTPPMGVIWPSWWIVGMLRDARSGSACPKVATAGKNEVRPLCASC